MKWQAACHLPAFASSQHVYHKSTALMCKSTVGTILQINLQIYITKPKNIVYTNVVHKVVIPAYFHKVSLFIKIWKWLTSLWKLEVILTFHQEVNQTDSSNQDRNTSYNCPSWSLGSGCNSTESTNNGFPTRSPLLIFGNLSQIIVLILAFSESDLKFSTGLLKRKQL